ncbi:MBL fold metallo-hydrolase [Roseomonas sp. OT10]|uniref:MBL fold metallo-hydrolase n=1 Tax=Roseomonas cutis TaxID=2897332 RepID=UPI001E332465|nr:MBL fold metallo-hydrolase [Roseomonas sp. OT10]UFN50096.1 MBL fold metallo-hydrolase [Roseomonas sp. OT10]
MSDAAAGGRAGDAAPATNRMDYHGFSTRQFTDSAYLLTGCFHMRMYGREFHTHASAYLLRGSAGAVLIDTGHAKDGPRIEAFIRSVVGDELTYIFPTHEEYPHAGNLGALLTAFPKSTAVGEARNLHLYHPGHARAGRFRQMRTGETLSLGDRTLSVLPALVHDLPATAWAHDDKDGLLFVSDAFGFSHYATDQCALLTREMPFRPTLEDTRMVLDLALYWARFADNHPLVADFRRMLTRYPTTMICPAHGNVVTEVEQLTALMEEALLANGIALPAGYPAGG